MLDLQEELGMSLILITHDLGVIAEVSDQVVVMYAGEIVEYAPIETLFLDPRHPYTVGLIGSIPKLGAKFAGGKQPLQEIAGLVPNLIRLPAGCLFAPRCDRVMERCRTQRPPLFILDSNHRVKCWLAEKEAQTEVGSWNAEVGSEGSGNDLKSEGGMRKSEGKEKSENTECGRWK